VTIETLMSKLHEKIKAGELQPHSNVCVAMRGTGLDQVSGLAVVCPELFVTNGFVNGIPFVILSPGGL
jgi:hypothetical protein